MCLTQEANNRCQQIKAQIKINCDFTITICTCNACILLEANIILSRSPSQEQALLHSLY